jgi:hypothetical protein
VLNQHNALEAFVVAKSPANVECIEEAGGGSQDTRGRFLELMDAIGCRDITMLILAYTDRLTRFDFDMVSTMPKPTSATCSCSIRSNGRRSRKWHPSG